MGLHGDIWSLIGSKKLYTQRQSNMALEQKEKEVYSWENQL